jgi:acyl phosphate:glycerol-3-phosphate acyltransferase
VRRTRLQALVVAAGLGYLLGSIPTADVVSRRVTNGEVDLRTAGSHNPGALNAMHALGPEWGVMVGIADVAKGVLACACGRAVAGDLGAHVAGSAAVAGHCYPVWSGFRGGKGVATAVGQSLATLPSALPVELAVGGLGAFVPARHRAFAVAAGLTVGWVGSAVLWWRQRRPNAWGCEPSPAMPIAAVVSSAIILHRFTVEARRDGTRSGG